MEEVIKSLGIQWQPIVTTIIGFAIFYWILRRFAFGPFMNLLEQRRETITSTFTRLEDERKDNEKMRFQYEDLIRNIEDERHKRLQEGLSEAKKLASEIEADARHKAENIVRRGEETAKREIVEAKMELTNYIIDLSIRSAELALKERITDEDHKRLIRRFIEELGTVESSESGRTST
jgi:F-type H+-transporting ATPase subunit b